MKKISFKYIFLIIPALTAIYLSYFVIPHGDDIEIAINVCKQVENLLLTNKYEVGDRHSGNAVMMKERRNRISVCIANPKPNESEIYKLIFNNRSKIDGDTLDLIFLNEDMREFKRYYIKD